MKRRHHAQLPRQSPVERTPADLCQATIMCLPGGAALRNVPLERPHEPLVRGNQNRSRHIRMQMAVGHHYAGTRENNCSSLALGIISKIENTLPSIVKVVSLSKAKSFDLGNYPQGQTRTVVFSRPGVVMANCHLHPNMTAAILVTPNKWFIRADSSGRFSLKAVPPGKHMIVAWHKSAGFFRQAIVVEAGHDVSVSFDIPLDEDGLLTQNATRN